MGSTYRYISIDKLPVLVLPGCQTFIDQNHRNTTKAVKATSRYYFGIRNKIVIFGCRHGGCTVRIGSCLGGWQNRQRMGCHGRFHRFLVHHLHLERLQFDVIVTIVRATASRRRTISSICACICTSTTMVAGCGSGGFHHGRYETCKSIGIGFAFWFAGCCRRRRRYDGYSRHGGTDFGSSK